MYVLLLLNVDFNVHRFEFARDTNLHVMLKYRRLSKNINVMLNLYIKLNVKLNCIVNAKVNFNSNMNLRINLNLNSNSVRTWWKSEHWVHQKQKQDN